MAWYLNRALSNFRAEVNAWKPNRDKGSDGTIGDAAHAASVSDHNPDPDGSVDAWDMDVELNGKGQPYVNDVEHLIRVFQGHESSRYWIWNGRVASRSTGWRRDPYTGSNRHDKHVHWNTSQAKETSNAPWPVRAPVVPKGDVDDMNRPILGKLTTSSTVWKGDGTPGSLMALRSERAYMDIKGALGATEFHYGAQHKGDARTLVDVLGTLPLEPGETWAECYARSAAAVEAAG